MPCLRRIAGISFRAYDNDEAPQNLLNPHFSHSHGSAPVGAAFSFTRCRDREDSGPRAANGVQAGEVLRAVRCVEGASGAVWA